jgi:antirestriction protein ArdC
MNKRDIYQTITDRVIDQLEKGVVPWVFPVNTGFPKNRVSKKSYRGINIFLLFGAPYDSRYWLSYKQAQDLGGHVRKGEKGSPVVFWHWRSEEELAKFAQKTPNPSPCQPFYYTVFNVKQCEGIEAPADDIEIFEHSPIEECERVIAAMPNRPQIEPSYSEKIYYAPVKDMVHIHGINRFASPERYYASLFHELAHATGHENRLNRQASTKHREFGSTDYSFEELVAEMTAAFLCAHCGIENHAFDQSVSYLNGWLKAFRKDTKILLDAASAAQKAADYILNRSFENEEQKEEQIAA